MSDYDWYSPSTPTGYVMRFNFGVARIENVSSFTSITLTDDTPYWRARDRFRIRQDRRRAYRELRRYVAKADR